MAFHIWKNFFSLIIDIYFLFKCLSVSADVLISSVLLQLLYHIHPSLEKSQKPWIMTLPTLPEVLSSFSDQFSKSLRIAMSAAI